MRDAPTDDDIRALVRMFPHDVIEFNAQRDEEHGSHLAFGRGELNRN